MPALQWANHSLFQKPDLIAPPIRFHWWVVAITEVEGFAIGSLTPQSRLQLGSKIHIIRFLGITTKLPTKETNMERLSGAILKQHKESMGEQDTKIALCSYSLLTWWRQIKALPWQSQRLHSFSHPLNLYRMASLVPAPQSYPPLCVTLKLEEQLPVTKGYFFLQLIHFLVFLLGLSTQC